MIFLLQFVPIVVASGVSVTIMLLAIRQRPQLKRMIADDAFPLHYTSPYLRGYQPTDTPPHQLPPQSRSVLTPVALDAQNRPISPMGDSFQALADALYLMANAGKVSITANHQEIEPYIPPEPLPTYDIVMSDEYEVSQDEGDFQKIEALPTFDERLISYVYR